LLEYEELDKFDDVFPFLSTNMVVWWMSFHEMSVVKVWPFGESRNLWTEVWMFPLK